MRPIEPQFFRQLQVFAAIVDAGSMTAAAQELGLSRSAVSLHLQHLETRLGVRLLERTTRRMALTQVGTQVLDGARRMTAAGRDAMLAAEDAAGQIRGVLRVAFPVELSSTLLLPALSTLRRAHPDLRIETRVSDMAVDLIRDGIDVAVRVGNPPDSSHIMRRLRPVTEIVIGSPTHHARWCDVSDPAELAGAPWLIHAIAQPPTLVLRHAQSDAEHTLRRQPTVSVDDSHLLINGVMAGLGIAIVPDVIAAHALRDGTTHRILPNWHARQVWLYTLEASRSSLPRRRAFIDALRVHLQGLDSIR